MLYRSTIILDHTVAYKKLCEWLQIDFLCPTGSPIDIVLHIKCKASHENSSNKLVLSKQIKKKSKVATNVKVIH